MDRAEKLKVLLAGNQLLCSDEPELVDDFSKNPPRLSLSLTHHIPYSFALILLLEWFVVVAAAAAAAVLMQ